MTVILNTLFGSHLYGTSTPASDFDYKSIIVPPARHILLQQTKSIYSAPRPKAHGEKNEIGENETEVFALHRYLQLLSDGQTVAMDILFTPPALFQAEPHPIWQEIFDNRMRLTTRKAASFVGYCRTQANKYGIRGSRVHAVRNIVEFLDRMIAAHGYLAQLGDVSAPLADLIADQALIHTAIIEIEQPRQNRSVTHLECCNRKVPFFATLKTARETYGRILDEYGSRALLAEQNSGVDWKALSHAVRVGEEAIEFLGTGKITFPLTYADEILAIKLGRVPYAQVADRIERLLDSVEAAQETSVLPDEPDHAFIEDLICRVYGEEVMRQRDADVIASIPEDVFSQVLVEAGSEASALIWLRSHNPSLGDTPLNYGRKRGFEGVLNLLQIIAYGGYA